MFPQFPPCRTRRSFGRDGTERGEMERESALISRLGPSERSATRGCRALFSYGQCRCRGGGSVSHGQQTIHGRRQWAAARRWCADSAEGQMNHPRALPPDGAQHHPFRCVRLCSLDRQRHELLLSDQQWVKSQRRARVFSNDDALMRPANGRALRALPIAGGAGCWPACVGGGDPGHRVS